MKFQVSAIGLLCTTMIAAPVQAHYVSSNCNTSSLGAGTCQKHSHPHRNVPSMGSSMNKNRTPAMGIDGNANTKAARIRVAGPEPENCGFLKRILVGC